MIVQLRLTIQMMFQLGVIAYDPGLRNKRRLPVLLIINGNLLYYIVFVVHSLIYLCCCIVAVNN